MTLLFIDIFNNRAVRSLAAKYKEYRSNEYPSTEYPSNGVMANKKY